MTEYSDGNQWHYITDVDAYCRYRDVYEMRAMSGTTGQMLVDTMWAQQRALVQPRVALFVHYQKPYAGQSPERQANALCDLLGELRPNEAVLLDIEGDIGVPDPADFTRRWLGVVEPRMGTVCQVYVPSALAGSLTPDVTGTRLRKAPRYSGTANVGAAPWWPHDIHQYSDKGWWPGGNGPGDINLTDLTAADLLARCRPAADEDDDSPLWGSIFTQFAGWKG